MSWNILYFTQMVTEKDDSQVISKMTNVRIAVAKSELISLTPIFAKIAVSEAKNAESKA